MMRALEIQLVNAPIGYGEAWAYQREAHRQRVAGERPDLLFLLEHRPVYTLGRSATRDHLLWNQARLTEAGIECVSCDRGGDITYHGPGQLVGYPIVHLPEAGLHVVEYVTALEEVLLRTAADFGVQANRDPRNRGIWVGNTKLAALGIRISHQVAMHGFAFNVSPKLSDFQGIIPCGLNGVGVTSLEQLLGKAPAMEDVISSVIRHFREVFRYDQVRELPSL